MFISYLFFFVILCVLLRIASSYLFGCFKAAPSLPEGLPPSCSGDSLYTQTYIHLSLSLSMHRHMYIYIYILCISYIYIYISIHTYMYIYIYVRMYAYVCMYVHVYVYVYVYVCVCIYMYTYIHTYIHNISFLRSSSLLLQASLCSTLSRFATPTDISSTQPLLIFSCYVFTCSAKDPFLLAGCHLL